MIDYKILTSSTIDQVIELTKKHHNEVAEFMGYIEGFFEFRILFQDGKIVLIRFVTDDSFCSCITLLEILQLQRLEFLEIETFINDVPTGGIYLRRAHYGINDN